MLRATAAAAAALALTSCAGQTRTGYGYITPFYDRSVVSHAASGGAFPLEVHGNPFPDLPQAQAAEAVARQMRRPGWFQPTPFALAPVAGAPRGDYRLVLVFNPARPVSSAEACGGLRETPLAPAAGPDITVRAAFCTRDETISDTTARGLAVRPDSPEFRQLLDQIAVTIFPERNRERDRDRGDNFVLRGRGSPPG